jgi:hypothetical protein
MHVLLQGTGVVRAGKSFPGDDSLFLVENELFRSMSFEAILHPPSPIPHPVGCIPLVGSVRRRVGTVIGGSNCQLLRVTI